MALINELKDQINAVLGSTIMAIHGLEHGAEHTILRDTSVAGQGNNQF